MEMIKPHKENILSIPHNEMGFTSDRHGEVGIHIDKGFGSIFGSIARSASGSMFGLGDGVMRVRLNKKKQA
jgi:hypothetical protein